MKPVTDVYILAIEVTQAIQCIESTSGYNWPDNSLELDSDRDIAVRVYVGHDGNSPDKDPFLPAVKGATVKLSWVATHLPGVGAQLSEHMSVKFDIPWSTNLSELRDDSRGSAVFIIPTSKLGKPNREKVLFIDAEVTAPSGLKEVNTQNNSKSIQIGETDASGNLIRGGLIPHKPLHVQWMLVDYRPINAYSTGFADPSVAGNVSTLMVKTYPMEVVYDWAGSWLAYDGSKCKSCVPIQNSKMSEWNELLMSLLWAKSLMKPEPDVLVGWLPLGANGSFSVYGLGTNAGQVSWFIQQWDKYRNQIGLAHEIAHTQGVDHVNEYGCPTTIVETGFDLETKRPVPSNTWDYMGSGGPNGWVSPFVWNKLLGKSYTCPGGAPSKPGQSWPQALSTEDQPTLLVSGGVNREKGGSIDSLYIIQSRGPFAHPKPDGAYCLVFEDGNGKLLARHCFDLRFVDLDSGKPTKNDGFFFRLQLPEGAMRVLLKQGSTILEQRAAHRYGPEVRISVPEGEVHGGEMEISWSGSHREGVELCYVVLFSPDAGDSWSPLAVNYLGDSMVVNTSLLRRGKRCKIRLLASDGFSTTTVDSSEFSLPSTQPRFWSFLCWLRRMLYRLMFR